MFEQNNVGVQMKSPVAAYVEQILSLLPLLSTGSCTSAFVSSLEKDVDFLLDATERILDNLEGNIRLYAVARFSFYKSYFLKCVFAVIRWIWWLWR